MGLQIMPAYDKLDEMRILFKEYTKSIMELNECMRHVLEAQNYEEEYLHLDEKYGLPSGRLYLAYYDEKPAGCIALRKLDEQYCEMKRFYVRDAFRGLKIGKKLADLLVEEARKAGYSFMRLDTTPAMETAVSMYKKMGFYEIGKYYDNPMDGALYLELALK